MLNGPRAIPYDFRVIEWDHEVLLIDASEHTYPCSTRPHFYFESLYSLPPSRGDGCHVPDCEGVVEENEWEESFCPVCGCEYDGLSVIEPGLVLVSVVDLDKAIKVELDSEHTHAGVSEREAWDAAREEANANHYL